jgi:three-Cys-motif partner protein
MMSPQAIHWPIEPHTQIKHLILRRYLEAWLPIMARHNGRILFVDGFAGPGRYQGGEEGSPMIALKALLDHPHFQQHPRQLEAVFIFIEKERDRAAALQKELRRLAESQPIPDWVKTYVVNRQFARFMTRTLNNLENEGHRLAPTFAFIDPFGFKGVPMKVIGRIAQNPRCECLITFMYEAINRFVAHPQRKVQAHFTRLFGTSRWKKCLDEEYPDVRRDGLASLYRKQLIERAGFKYVRTFEMINRGNRTEYFLYFGSNNIRGLSKMKEAMWRADPMQGQVFSDRTDPNQLVLLQPEPDLSALRKLLRERFRDEGWICIDKVENFVLLDTPYSEVIHLKRRTLEVMERKDPPHRGQEVT